jgi:Translation initiation factor 2, gamma subunit (eIF-2gamma; GTPase)
MPYNIYAAFFFISSLLFAYFRFRKKPFVHWLSGVPGAISSILLLALLVLIFGFLPQGNPDVPWILKIAGLDRVKTSWIFLLAQFFFLTSLGMTTIKRIYPFNIKNIGFFINHFGLFLTLSAAVFGAGDIRRLEINLLKEGNESSIGVSGQGTMYKLPFSLKLVDFKIDEYNPRIAVMDAHSGRLVNTDKIYPMAEKGLNVKLNNWQISVTNYLPSAVVIDSTVQPSPETGSCPAAFIRAISKSGKDTVMGWMLAGSYLQDPAYLVLDSNNLLALTKPEPQKYSSRILVRTDSIHKDTVSLEVNKPYKVKGWTIYQVGFDQSKGKWSSLSVLEAVSDPWLPLVYTGFFMLIAGALLLFWTGKRRKSDDVTDN